MRVRLHADRLAWLLAVQRLPLFQCGFCREGGWCPRFQFSVLLKGSFRRRKKDKFARLLVSGSWHEDVSWQRSDTLRWVWRTSRPWPLSSGICDRRQSSEWRDTTSVCREVFASVRNRIWNVRSFVSRI